MTVLLSRRDLEFLLYDWLDAESLLTRPRFAEHSRETFDAVLDLAAQVAAEQFAPHNKRADAEEPTFCDDSSERTESNARFSATGGRRAPPPSPRPPGSPRAD